jgi:hypothetical protein
MDLSETVVEDVDWIHLAQDGNQWRGFVNTMMNLRVPVAMEVKLIDHLILFGCNMCI